MASRIAEAMYPGLAKKEVGAAQERRAEVKSWYDAQRPAWDRPARDIPVRIGDLSRLVRRVQQRSK